MSEAPKARRLPAHQERAVSVAAGVDPRTVRKVLAGLPVRSGLVRERIEKALRDLGIDVDKEKSWAGR
jgi:hypothetical protein